MAIQGFNFDGDTYKYDYDALENKPDLSTDKTLKVTNKPADAKAVGDAISTLNSKLIASQTVITPGEDDLTTQLDSFINTMGAYETRFIEIQIGWAITVGSLRMMPGRRFAIVFRHSNANYACVLLMSWIQTDGLELMVKTNGVWAAKLIS